jgi:hypothetical protein
MRLMLPRLMAVLLVLGGIASGLRAADDGIPVPRENDVADTTALLGQEFKDESNGFRLQVPFGARIFQRSGLELMSFVHDSKQWAGNVQLLTLEKDMNVEELLRSRSGDLQKVFKAVQIIESRDTIVSGKPAGKLISTLEAQYPVQVGRDGKPIKLQSIPLVRQELMVQTATNQYMVMTFFAPLEQKDQAIKIFDAMVGTFELLDRKAIEARRLSAVKVGQDWIAKIKAEDLVSRIVQTPQLFRILIENKDVGYLRIDEAADVTKDGFKGIMVAANSRTFPADGSMILGANEAFWGYHDQGGKLGELPNFSSWVDKAGTALPSDPGAPKPAPRVSSTDIKPGMIIHGVSELPPSGIVRWTQEIGTLQLSLHPEASSGNDIQMRQQYDISVSMAFAANNQDVTNRDMDRPLHWVISPDLPAPLPKPLEYLWPRLVDLTKESQRAVVVFNPAQSKLALRVLTVGKPETVTIDGAALQLTRLTDEIGAASTTLWVDDAGTIKMMRTNDGSVLVPTTEEQMKTLWGQKLTHFR